MSETNMEEGSGVPLCRAEAGRYIVYPDGALSWSEIKETVDLLEFEGKNPKIVKYKGLWNVEAGGETVR